MTEMNMVRKFSNLPVDHATNLAEAKIVAWDEHTGPAVPR